VRLGQGREASKEFLLAHADTAREIEGKIREKAAPKPAAGPGDVSP